MISKARSYMRQGSYNESRATFNAALNADPFSLAAWMGKGEVETHLGAYDDAVTAFRRAIKINPGDADPWIGIGNAYLAAGDYEQAIASFKRALAIYPGQTRAAENLSLAEDLKATMLLTKDTNASETDPAPANEQQGIPLIVDVTPGMPAIPVESEASMPGSTTNAPKGSLSLLTVAGSVGLFLILSQYKRR